MKHEEGGPSSWTPTCWEASDNMRCFTSNLPSKPCHQRGHVALEAQDCKRGQNVADSQLIVRMENNSMIKSFLSTFGTGNFTSDLIQELKADEVQEHAIRSQKTLCQHRV